MITVKLIGGLGNQMFQYAFGRHLAIKNNTNLLLDTRFLKSPGITARDYELDLFKIQAEVYKNQTPSRCFIKIICQKILNKRQKNYLQEKSYNFNQANLEAKDETYADGYWQSAKYFQEIEDTIKKDFTLKNPIDFKFKDLIKEMTYNNSISLHIRRGDYIKNKKINQFHGVCSLDYYNDAVNYITKKINNLYFYIFSDDLTWVKENFKIKYPVFYVEQNKGFEDMYLMSCCKHNIIANSSFSWWGAWLNKNPSKIVIAPKQWFNNKVNTEDVVPEEWVKL